MLEYESCWPVSAIVKEMLAYSSKVYRNSLKKIKVSKEVPIPGKHSRACLRGHGARSTNAEGDDSDDDEDIDITDATKEDKGKAKAQDGDEEEDDDDEDDEDEKNGGEDEDGWAAEVMNINMDVDDNIQPKVLILYHLYVYITYINLISPQRLNRKLPNLSTR